MKVKTEQGTFWSRGGFKVLYYSGFLGHKTNM